MSFRIDDILKDTKVRDEKKFVENEKCINLIVKETNNSILQQTLLQNGNYYMKDSSDIVSKVYENYRPFHRMYFTPYNYLDSYGQKGYQYLTSNNVTYCTKNRFWPPYYYATNSMQSSFNHHFSKRKGGQVRFTTNQTNALEKRFVSHKYLSPEDRRILAETLKLSDRQVKTWFQNRRAKWRRLNSVSSSNTDANNDSECEIEICRNSIEENIMTQ